MSCEKTEAINRLREIQGAVDGLISEADMNKGKKSELVDLPELKKLEDEPLFYHPDECDCITCHARTEKGGLDYDPSDDSEEFERHEKEVFRDVGITTSDEEKPVLEILGKDGNVFNIIGLATKAGRQAGWDKERIKKFQEDCFSGDYDHVLQLCMENFEVT